MSQVINTNIMSLNAQRNLAGTSTELATALERLSSGLRINSAKDDAAGLAITERFTTQIRGLNQAVRNANDGISLAQTGEGALAEMNNNLQRIRELAVQSANATNSDSDRAALDQEVQQRLAEIDRIAQQTSFNGRKILDGSFGNALFQVGANVGETINIDLETSMRLRSIGDIATAESVDLRELMTEGEPTHTFNGFDRLDFGAGDGVSGTVNINDTEYTITDVGSLEDLAALLDAAPEVSVQAVDGNLVFTLEEGIEDNIAIDFDLIDSAGTAANIVEADTPINVTAATIGEETDTLDVTTLDLGAGNFSADGEVTLSVDDAAVTVDISAVTDMDGLADAIQAAMRTVDGLDDFEVTYDAVGDDLIFTNYAGDPVAIELTITDDDAAPTTVTYNDTVAAATVAPETTAITGVDLNNLDLDSGVTGTFEVDGTAVNFELAEGTNTVADLASAMNQGLVDAGIGGLVFEDDGAGGLQVVSSRANALDITDLTFTDGAATHGTYLDEAELIPERSVTINEGGLVFQIDDGPEMTIAAGEYTDVNDFLNALNSAFGSNATASYNDETGTFTMVTGGDLTVSGDSAEVFFDEGFVLDDDGNVFFETVGSLDEVNVLTVGASNDAIYRVDAALTTVSNLRSTFGAVQNRFESTIANLSTTVENLSASRSRIQDADFAAETANLTRAQILQQAGTAMLAQANQIPQGVLQLLG